jgi:predicted GTPase
LDDHPSRPADSTNDTSTPNTTAPNTTASNDLSNAPAATAAATAKSRQVSRRESKKLAQYADLRRQQYETLNALLETLTTVDNLDNQHLERLRDAIFHADHPFLLTLVGPFSSGKSSVINALLGEKALQVGPTPTTDHVSILRHGESSRESRTGSTTTVFHPSEVLERLSLVDTPGLESVFEQHDELTRKFLHRADILWLVMIATQVLTANDLKFMQSLKAYGKRMMIIVNQVDVLDAPDRETIRAFVEEQARLHLGMKPTIWLVSAKQALTAYAGSVRDEIVWDESGFADLEEYLFETLDDEQRVIQKLETPMQVARNVTTAALEYVRATQSTLSDHRKTLENLNAQIAASEKDRRRIVAKLQADIHHEWEKAIEGGENAVDDLFQIQRALGQSLGGAFELVGLGALMRRFRRRTQAEEAFMRYEVRETIQRVPEITNKIGPALEGRDQEEVDQMVDYTRQQMKRLPENLQSKIIGNVRSPMSYDRKALRTIRGDLEDIITKAGTFETKNIDRALRSVMIAMSVWMFITVVLALLVLTGTILGANNNALNLILIVALFIVGLALLPLRGTFIKYRYRRRLQDLRRQYESKLGRAVEQQIEYGSQLRQDVAAPFTRLISTQIEQSDTLKTDLEQHEQRVIGLQHKLSGLVKD